MDSCERVIRAIERTGPDRPPITHATLPGAETRYGAELEALYAQYPADVLMVGSATHGEYGPEINVPSRDTWGSLWVRPTDEHKGQIVHCPLASWEALDAFEPPDTATDEIIAEIQARLSHNASQRYTLADGDIIWQRMFYLHGYEAMLQDLVLEPKRCEKLRDLIVDVMMRRVERLCQLPELDGIHFRDDWGTQRALMIRPSLWRSFFKPSYARLFAPVRDANKHVWFHSDGAIADIIPDLIEIGAQVFNPQVDSIGRDRLAELIGEDAAIQGDVDRQWILPYGSPEDVRAAVRTDIEAFGGRRGGYIARGQVASDVPLVNIAALFEEVNRAFD